MQIMIHFLHFLLAIHNIIFSVLQWTSSQSLLKEMGASIWLDLFKTNVYWLHLSGLWPEKNYNFGLYLIYSLVSYIFFMVAHCIFQLMVVISLFSDSKALMEAIYVCFLGVLDLFKIYIFMRRVTSFKGLLIILQSDILQPRKSQLQSIQPEIKFLVKIYYVWVSLCVLSVLLWMIFPILFGGIQDYALPFPASYPFDYKKAFLYPLTYVHQGVSILLIVVASTNIDFLIWASMFCIGAQCDILCDNLRNLEDFKVMLKQCINHHKLVLRFVSECQESFNGIILAQIFTSSLCIGVVVYLLSSEVVGSFSFCQYLMTVSSLIMQCFPYCWFGGAVQSQSGKIAYAAFESGWIDQNMPEKRSLMIFVQMLQAPIKFSPFKLFDLSLEIFVKIVKSAMSYYTIAQQVGDSI